MRHEFQFFFMAEVYPSFCAKESIFFEKYKNNLSERFNLAASAPLSAVFARRQPPMRSHKSITRNF
jgi:hypothetical protein